MKDVVWVKLSPKSAEILHQLKECHAIPKSALIRDLIDKHLADYINEISAEADRLNQASSLLNLDIDS
jgi:hypothetical protein